MPIMSKPSSSAFTSLAYITVGALMIIWTGIEYMYLKNATEPSLSSLYWCDGFMLTGITLLVIGLALGRIGRAARKAELPPS